MIRNTEILIDCPVLQLYSLLGKKWTCPILMNIDSQKNYTFEEIIQFTSRQINRTLLSNLLKDMIDFKILTYKNRSYKLSKRGKKMKNLLKEFKKIILEDYSPNDICYLKTNCLVSTFKNNLND